MGQAFSTEFPDESLDVISKEDAFSELILAICWAGTFYVIGMIFTTVKIIDRWRGPRDDNPTGFFSVLGALILALAWPAVLVILALSSH
ncbi:hypothetical protein SPBR_01155 [Sporothrix brasiliensis 5110]|uniref:Uncharacterized protein n=1 Tax=Sporothrix brasiliensis 5110 TaxID=1398154 RepID=A0A0C2J025_9PEZI|nr:uncharacterized protein SPBR_01155 [Sporothrix brasiliensis 5110]KIH90552.1 hypothetical protein SPBR_01155 [Sporothrix brasiliensis 5110]